MTKKAQYLRIPESFDANAVFAAYEKGRELCESDAEEDVEERAFRNVEEDQAVVREKNLIRMWWNLRN